MAAKKKLLVKKLERILGLLSDYPCEQEFNALLQDAELARLLCAVYVARLGSPVLFEQVEEARDVCEIGQRILHSPLEDAIAAAKIAIESSAVDKILSSSYFSSAGPLVKRLQRKVKLFSGTPKECERVNDLMDHINRSFSACRTLESTTSGDHKYGKLEQSEISLLVSMLQGSEFCREFLVPNGRPLLCLSLLQLLQDSTERARLILLNSDMCLFYGCSFSYAELRKNWQPEGDLLHFLKHNLYQPLPSPIEKQYRCLALCDELTRNKDEKVVNITADCYPDAVPDYLKDDLTESQLRVYRMLPRTVLTKPGSEKVIACNNLYFAESSLWEARKLEPSFKRKIWKVYADSEKKHLPVQQIADAICEGSMPKRKRLQVCSLMKLEE